VQPAWDLERCVCVPATCSSSASARLVVSRYPPRVCGEAIIGNSRLLRQEACAEVILRHCKTDRRCLSSFQRLEVRRALRRKKNLIGPVGKGDTLRREITAPSVTPWRSTPPTRSAGGVMGGAKVISNFPRDHFRGWQESCISLR